LKYHCIYDKFISVIHELQDAVGPEIAKAYLAFLSAAELASMAGPYNIHDSHSQHIASTT
jgi:hypothetical protein